MDVPFRVPDPIWPDCISCPGRWGGVPGSAFMIKKVSEESDEVRSNQWKSSQNTELNSVIFSTLT